jgi:hypothetical protein
VRPPAASPLTLALRLVALTAVGLAPAACGPSTIRVDGVIRDAPEMRPLQNVPADAYRGLRVVVRPAGGSDTQGAAECGHMHLEGTLESEDRNNTACIPADAPNDAVRVVRQRLRTYGLQVAREGSDPYDYVVEVRVTGVAPKEPNPLLAKAAAKLTFTLRGDDTKDGFFQGVDLNAADAAFAGVARDCALRDAELTTFSVTSTQPMIPEFDMMALAGDAVDNAIGCGQLARFFRDVHTNFPKAAAPAPATPPPPPAPAR